MNNSNEIYNIKMPIKIYFETIQSSFS